MDHRHDHDRRTTTWILAVCAGAVVFVLVLFAGLLGSSLGDDPARRCPFTRTTTGDYVPAGARPCTLYGTSHGGSGAARTNDSWSTSHTGTRRPAKTSPKAPVAKAPAAPKAPAAKAPAAKAPVVKAPPVRLSK